MVLRLLVLLYIKAAIAAAGLAASDYAQAVVAQRRIRRQYQVRRRRSMRRNRHILRHHRLAIGVIYRQLHRLLVRQIQRVVLLLADDCLDVDRVPRPVNGPVGVDIGLHLRPCFPAESITPRSYQRRVVPMPRQNPNVLRLSSLRSSTNLHGQQSQPIHSGGSRRLQRPAAPQRHVRLLHRRARLPVRHIKADLAATGPFHQRNACDNGHGVRLVRSVRSLDQVHPSGKPVDGQLLRLAHNGRRRHQLPARHQLALVQQRNLRKLRCPHHLAAFAQFALALAEVIPRHVGELPAKEVPDPPPQVGLEVVQPLDPRLLVDLLLGRVTLHPKAMHVLQPGEKLLRVPHLVDAKLQRRHVPRKQLDFHALARRKRARRR